MFSSGGKEVSEPSVFLQDFLLRAWGGEAGKEARNTYEKIAREVPAVSRMSMVPQGAPHHVEGANVSSHITHMLSALHAFTSRPFAEIEEFAREKDLALEWESLEKTLKNERVFLTAYAITHDLGKDTCLSFSSTPGSKGGGEGFGKTERATAPERARYDKLLRAFFAESKEGDQEVMLAKFHEKMSITVHYFGHDREGASGAFAEAREAVGRAVGLPPSYLKMLTELIRLHMDVITGFCTSHDKKLYESFLGIGMRAGLNKDLFLELLPACLLLDAVLGSKQGDVHGSRHELKPIINWYKSEREADPARHEERKLKKEREKKEGVKRLLAEAGLAPEVVFTLLKTPFGPVRGDVMRLVYDLIHDPDGDASFGEKTEEIRTRARRAQELFRAHGVEIKL